MTLLPRLLLLLPPLQCALPAGVREHDHPPLVTLYSTPLLQVQTQIYWLARVKPSPDRGQKIQSKVKRRPADLSMSQHVGDGANCVHTLAARGVCLQKRKGGVIGGRLNSRGSP